jgi:signal peptidase I
MDGELSGTECEETLSDTTPEGDQPPKEAPEPQEQGTSPPQPWAGQALGQWDEQPVSPPDPQAAEPSPTTSSQGLGSQSEAPAQRGLSLQRVLVDVVETLVLAIFIFLAVRFSFQNFRVEGVSMAPSLEDGEYLIVNKLAYLKIDLSVFDWLPFFDAGNQPVRYLFGAPQRGDVVVFRSPDDSRRDFIKRIIGLPGDTVAIDSASGRVLVNGLPLQEPYAVGRTQCSAALMGCGPWVVPPGHYFVLGDNREQSTDSRFFGFVPEANIIGKALITYWPPEDFGLAPNHSVSFASQ